MSHVFNIEVKNIYTIPLILTEKEFNLLYTIPKVKTGYFIGRIWKYGNRKNKFN